MGSLLLRKQCVQGAQAEGNSSGERAFPRAKPCFVQETSGHKLDLSKWTAQEEV